MLDKPACCTLPYIPEKVFEALFLFMIDFQIVFKKSCPIIDADNFQVQKIPSEFIQVFDPAPPRYPVCRVNSVEINQEQSRVANIITLLHENISRRQITMVHAAKISRPKNSAARAISTRFSFCVNRFF